MRNTPVVGRLKVRLLAFSAALLAMTSAGNAMPVDNYPVAIAGGPYTVAQNFSFHLDGSASFDPDPGDTIAQYSWTLLSPHDATGPNPLIPANFFPSVGLWTISLMVTDSFGLSSTAATTVLVEAARAVPEPASLAIFGGGIAGLGLIRRRRTPTKIAAD